MVKQDLGEATIVYEDPDEGTVEKTVQNENIAYFQDHWMIKTGEDEQGRDVARRVPAQRVYYVERTVQKFEEEIKTVRHQVQSLTDDIRSKILGGGSGGGSSRGGSSGGRSSSGGSGSSGSSGSSSGGSGSKTTSSSSSSSS